MNNFCKSESDDYREQYVVTGVKPTGLQSIMEHGGIKISNANIMGRGESDCGNTKTGKPISWGFSSYDEKVHQYASWVVLSLGLYMQVWLELESLREEDWMLEKQSKSKKHLPDQMGYNENHRIRAICIRIIYVNALRACRPTGHFQLLHGVLCLQAR